jgi:hypothetical protein
MIAAPETLEFDIYTDEASVRRAAERIRAGIGLRSVPAATMPTEPDLRSEARYPLATAASLVAVRLHNGRATQVDPDDPPVPVMTLNMSPHGVGIEHDQPVPDRTCIINFGAGMDEPVSLLVRHRWFRQEDGGGACRYRSGFEILGVAKTR